MRVSVRDLSARCKGCGGRDFMPRNGGAPHLGSVMICMHCGRETTYRELLESIGEEAIRRANEAFAKLKKNGPGRRKPKK